MARKGVVVTGRGGSGKIANGWIHRHGLGRLPRLFLGVNSVAHCSFFSGEFSRTFCSNWARPPTAELCWRSVRVAELSYSSLRYVPSVASIQKTTRTVHYRPLPGVKRPYELLTLKSALSCTRFSESSQPDSDTQPKDVPLRNVEMAACKGRIAHSDNDGSERWRERDENGKSTR